MFVKEAAGGGNLEACESHLIVLKAGDWNLLLLF